MEEEKNMRRKSLMRDKRGQVLGLPMYLIVIMIVAVAIIAAVIVMIPRGSQTMNAQVTENAIVAEDPGDSGAFTFTNAYDVAIKVTSNDERADPISGATVTLIGAGVSGEGTTSADGTVTISLTPKLGANVNEAYIKMTVKASGYEDFVDDEAVTIARL